LRKPLSDWFGIVGAAGCAIAVLYVGGAVLFHAAAAARQIFSVSTNDSGIGSGGIGSVSVGLSEPLIGLLLAGVIPLGLNRLMAGWSRRTGYAAGLLRAHSAALALMMALAPILAVAALVIEMSLRSVGVAIMIGGIVVAVQFWLLSALLFAFAWRLLSARRANRNDGS
jgi:hypothetical protein